MNDNHARVCTSPEWALHIQTDILPALTRDVDLGDRMLEIGPGPGAATEWLRSRVGTLTAIEVDETASALLASRYASTNVEVVTTSAAELSYPDASYDSVGCFTMLHHVPTMALQNAILAEAFRVLRPGGRLGISDVTVDDAIDPVRRAAAEREVGCLAGALTRREYHDLLAAAGFTHIRITATRPAGDGLHSAIIQAVKPATPK